MQISKRTTPSLVGGLMNPAFLYVQAVSTDITKTFAKARAAQTTQPLFPDTEAIDRAFGRVTMRQIFGGARP